MIATRLLTGLALAAAALSAVSLPSAAQAAIPTPAVAVAPDSAAAPAVTWGPRYSPGRGAKASGSLRATGEDHADIPAAETVRISGRVQDLTRASATCGLAVFRITYRTSDGNLPFTHRTIRDCSYGTPQPFTFDHRNVYQVELKVCSEARAAQPSLNCLYAGTWKVLYLSR
ncbi:hypothetical protein [Streptosporangium pseudovulgare]|uniref:Uncharacterized protein n=1 Tax=Streptosporangium pseudovulgare TaxID=35765 RepID=A0ABQ2QJN1_9ACTN|nr:hypothetical protein [Streptosporangium pseudovulgare]GGP85009.1 hypothetical protein GCM10010140_12840 [Streptosporangium pseudovulgare]